MHFLTLKILIVVNILCNIKIGLKFQDSCLHLGFFTPFMQNVTPFRPREHSTENAGF
jgi:hypothetical protein